VPHTRKNKRSLYQKLLNMIALNKFNYSIRTRRKLLTKKFQLFPRKQIVRTVWMQIRISWLEVSTFNTFASKCKRELKSLLLSKEEQFWYTAKRITHLATFICKIMKIIMMPFSLIFTVVPCILILSKHFIYQLTHNRFALKEY
jgi:hypothetical protein